MKNLYVCNTARDEIEKFDLKTLKVVDSIKLEGKERIWPYRICVNNKTLIISSYKNNAIFLIDENGLVEEFYLGSGCTDMKIVNNYLYVVCEESNTVVCFDIISKEIIEVIPCGMSPRNIDFSKVTNKFIVSNALSKNITVFDLLEGGGIQNINVDSNPVKAIWNVNGESIFICENNVGVKRKGILREISLDTKKERTIEIGNIPVDMCYDGEYFYISNWGDGTISIVDAYRFKEISRLKVGGMLKKILIDDKIIYVSEIQKNNIIRIDNNRKKTLSLDYEPQGIIIQ